ncbi:MAG: hypothetical protein M3N34_06550 [Pseudomonadota bacterium]|nr:hypothetical protein [Pseudomonadota bacterium]
MIAAMLAGLGIIQSSTVATAQNSGMQMQIQTLPLGAYMCELPGDAMHAAGVRVPAEDFAVVHSSTYESGGKQGSYLLTANVIQMTSGPRAGEKFHRISNNFLRKLSADGTDSELRCIRRAENDRQ